MASLLALSRAAAERAKHLFRLRLIAHGGTALLGISGLAATANVATVLVIGGVLTEGAGWYARWRARVWHERAEEARRCAILMNAFGQKSEPSGAIDLRTCLDELENDAASFEDPAYYATTAAPGAMRLKEILEESAFWSKHLYAKSSSRAFAWIVVGTLFLLLVGFGTASFGSGTVGSVITKVLAIALLAAFAIDELGQAIDWNRAAARLTSVDHGLQTLVAPTAESLLPIFAEYCVATEGAPPIPSSIYKSQKAHLNSLWASRQRVP